MKWYLSSFLLLITIVTIAQKEDPFLRELLLTRPAQFGEIVSHPDKYRVQIVYTQIIRDAKNRKKHNVVICTIFFIFEK